MANIKWWICSSIGRPSSGLNLGSHLSRFLGRGCSGGAMWSTPRLFHGFFTILGMLGIDEVAEDVEGEEDWAVEYFDVVLLIITTPDDCGWEMDGMRGW